MEKSEGFELAFEGLEVMDFAEEIENIIHILKLTLIEFFERDDFDIKLTSDAPNILTVEFIGEDEDADYIDENDLGEDAEGFDDEFELELEDLIIDDAA